MILLAWIFFSIAAAMFAHIRRNRNAAGWFFVALLISPIVAFVLLAILRPAAPSDRQLNFSFVSTLGVIATLIVVIVWFVISSVHAQQQTFRDASGRVVSTATRSGNQTTYRDAGGRTIGTSTTDSAGDTVLRNAAGRSIGTINGSTVNRRR